MRGIDLWANFSSRALTLILLSLRMSPSHWGCTGFLSAVLLLLYLGRKLCLLTESAAGSVQTQARDGHLFSPGIMWLQTHLFSQNPSGLCALSLSVPKTTSSSAISHKSLEHGTWNNKKKQEFNNKYGKVHKQENWNQMKGAVERRRLGKSLHSLSRTTIPDCAFSLPSAYAPRRFENIFCGRFKALTHDWKLTKKFILVCTRL